MSILYLTWQGNIDIKDEAELLNAFFSSVSNRKTRCPQGTHPPELEDKDRKQNKPL